MSMVVTDAGIGIAAVRSSTDGSLRAAVFGGTNWSLLNPLAAGLIAAGPPSLTAGGDAVHAIYRGVSGSFDYASFNAGVWSPTSEPSGSTGATEAVIATTPLGAPIIAFVTASGELVDRSRVGGVWQAEHTHGLAGSLAAVRPNMVALASGPELLMVFVKTGGQVAWTTRTAGTWSAPQDVAGALTNDAPTLSVLADGDVLLGIRSTTNEPLLARFSTSADPPWSAMEGIANPNPLVTCPPAISPGAQGADIELVYVDVGGVAYWSRRSTTGWSPGVLVGFASAPSCMAVAVAP
jgi:hypothetical protein